MADTGADRPRKFDDVPPAYRENVNINSVPYNRREGSMPALTDSNVDDLLAFLQTLTDAAYVKQQAESIDK